MTRLLCLMPALLFIPPAAHAETTLTVVGNYDKAGDSSVWAAPSPYEVPKALIHEVKIPTPSRAYTYPHPTVFLQNERVVVCNVSCDDVQNLVPRLEGKDTFKAGLSAEPSRRNEDLDGSLLRQMTVFYWVNAVLDRFEELGHSFDHRLEIFVDRDITDPDTGETLTNNAFFLSTQVDVVDWSLSFLPSTKGLGMSFLHSGYDPSVAMHEATHFIFQELVGDILNPEVYGLHEAFADYFAMAILNSPDIGEVMMKGRPLRSAAKILQYEPNMEVHDLGNVVVSALWNIRERFPDVDRADQVAFHTIQNVGDNPFADAGYVTEAYYDALNFHAEDLLQADPGLMGEIDRIWEATGLEVPSIEPNLDALKAPVSDEESRSAVTMTIQINAPEDAILQFGLPPIAKDTVTLITTRPGPQGTDYTWFMVAIQDFEQNAPAATPFWILYSPSTRIIRYAYTIDGSLVTVASDSIDEYKRLVSLNEQLGTLLDYAAHFAADLAPLADGGKWQYLKARKVEISNGYYNYGFSDKLLPMVIYSVRVRPTFGGWVISLFGASHIRSTKEIRLYAVGPDAIDTQRLPTLEDGGMLVGYEMIKKTGLKIALRLDELGEDRPAQ